jgi:hypothetical protein
MSTFPGGEGPLMDEGPRHEYPGVEVFGHVEGLCREETELLEVAEHQRTAEQHQRLQAISEELDRTWEHLHERAQRLGRHPPG